jgi:ABC-type tungstate transport system substrate-binding protein
MIPVETVVGITHGWRFTQQHPILTGVVIAVPLALALIAAIRSRQNPKRKNLLRAVSLTLMLCATGFFSWAYNTRSPDFGAQIEKLAYQVSADCRL